MAPRGIARLQVAALLCLVAVGQAEIRGGCAEWDDSYGEAIRQASITKHGADVEFVENVMQGSMWNWKNLREYRDVRELLRGVAENATGMVRVEVGNGNAGSYDVTWVVRTTSATWVVIGGKELTRAERIDNSRWDRLERALETANAWTLGSEGDTSVDDGSTTFVSICLRDRSTQFAVYGLYLGKSPRADTEFAKRTAGQRLITRAVLDLVPRVTSR